MLQKFKEALLFDIETNGFLPELDTIHCLVVQSVAHKQIMVFSSGSWATGTVQQGVQLLLSHTQQGGIICGHNAIKFDVPALQKIFPDFKPPTENVWDTLVLSRLIYPDLTTTDLKLIKPVKEKPARLPKHLFKRHSLEAWGHRLGTFKGDYEGDPSILDEKERKKRRWECWNQTMEDYCVQDVVVTESLWNKLMSKVSGTPQCKTALGFSLGSLVLETQVAHIIARQERYGFCFDTGKAAQLYSMLVKEKLQLDAKITEVFKPRFFKDGPVFEPKRDNKTLGYLSDVPVQKVKLVEFNPGSRDHITAWFKALYGWKPREFTEDGKAKVDETILASLSFPEAPLLRKYLTVVKRIAALSEGREGWIRREKNGRIHGSVITNGAVTGRMTHSGPNMAQIPAAYSPYGKECRELFCVPEGKLLVGTDAEALELRCLAGYMARYDGGAYIKTVLEGSKEAGTDIHSVNARALGLDPKKIYFEGESGRDLAKTWFYAFIYGAGDEKLGFILTKRNLQIEAGRLSRARFMKKLPALGALVAKVQQTIRDDRRKRTLVGIDGRLLPIRSAHAALNTLLQSAGAVFMKQALVIADQSYQALGWTPGVHYEFVVNVHDEFQQEVDEDKAKEAGRLAVGAIRKAGEHFGFKCPLDGESKLGRTWAETH